MDLDDIKHDWNQMGTTPLDKEQDGFPRKHPRLHALRRRLWVESAGVVLFLIIFPEALAPPALAAEYWALLYGAGLLYVGTRVWGYVQTLAPPKGGSLVEALGLRLRRLWWRGGLSWASALLFVGMFWAVQRTQSASGFPSLGAAALFWTTAVLLLIFLSWNWLRQIRRLVVVLKQGMAQD